MYSHDIQRKLFASNNNQMDIRNDITSRDRLVMSMPPHVNIIPKVTLEEIPLWNYSTNNH